MVIYLIIDHIKELFLHGIQYLSKKKGTYNHINERFRVRMGPGIILNIAMTVSELTVCSFPQISTEVLSTTQQSLVLCHKLAKSLTSDAKQIAINLCGY
ncbi:MAG: hypothetical protein ACXAEX_05985 [Promethearchaeota archaeon]|jgi:hypothetical protein